MHDAIRRESLSSSLNHINIDHCLRMVTILLCSAPYYHLLSTDTPGCSRDSSRHTVYINHRTNNHLCLHHHNGPHMSEQVRHTTDHNRDNSHQIVDTDHRTNNHSDAADRISLHSSPAADHHRTDHNRGSSPHIVHTDHHTSNHLHTVTLIIV